VTPAPPSAGPAADLPQASGSFFFGVVSSRSSMAQIRYVDTWLRSPGSHPNHYRSVMVIAEKWAEQRVLMRAYAESRDQTRPTILLHGVELAIGPAGIDANGPWGVHVGEPEERAHLVKQQIEEAARRIAGSKGNPPRLADEESTFDREPTGNWGPGAPRVLPAGAAQPAHIAPPPPSGPPSMPPAGRRSPTPQSLHKTPTPRVRSGKTVPPSRVARTALGYASGSGAQSAVVRLGLAPAVSAKLGHLADRSVPAEFTLDAAERRALNALGEAEHVSARLIGHVLELGDPVSFMEELMKKLEQFGLGDLVEPGEPVGGEPTYRMRR
jgi:hypothetical protein